MPNKKYDSIKLNNQLCFPLYACSKDIIRRYKPYLDKIDLTYTQYITMMVMWEHEELILSDLGDYVCLDSGTLTPLLKKLEIKGYVKREKSKVDERALNIRLTTKGRNLRDEAIKIHKNMAECIKLDKEELDVLYKLLYKILDRGEDEKY